MTTTTRDAFEVWFAKRRGAGMLGKSETGGYEWVATSEAFEAWQAATAAAAAVEVPPWRNWKVGDEFLPYHPQASHVDPSYRDGWNACYKVGIAAAPASQRVQPLDAQGKRQPLTDEQIAEKWRAAYLSSKAFTTIATYTYFAREIEALHGIKAK